MTKNKRYLFIAITIALATFIYSCGTVEGFEESKTSATDARAKADEAGVSKDDSIYKAAMTDFDEAVAKEKKKDQKGALESYTEAEGQFKTAVKKKETGDAVKVLDNKIMSLDDEIDNIE